MRNFYANVQSYKKYSIYARRARKKLTKNDKKCAIFYEFVSFSHTKREPGTNLELSKVAATFAFGNRVAPTERSALI